MSKLITEFKRFIKESTSSSTSWWEINYDRFAYLIEYFGCLEFNKSEISEIEKLLPGFSVTLISSYPIIFRDKNMNFSYLSVAKLDSPRYINTFIYKIGDDRIVVTIKFGEHTYECDGIDGLADFFSNKIEFGFGGFKFLESVVLGEDNKLWREIDWNKWRYLMEIHGSDKFPQKELDHIRNLLTVKFSDKNKIYWNHQKDSSEIYLSIYGQEKGVKLSISKLGDERFLIVYGVRRMQGDYYECDGLEGLEEFLKYVYSIL